MFWLRDIHGAIESGCTDEVKALLQDPKKLELLNHDGATPLITAARTGNGAMVQLLLQAGAAINAQDKKGKSALRYAIDNANIEITQRLLLQNPDLAQLANDGKTVLEIAIGNAEPNIAALLINAGAEVNVDDIQSDLFAVACQTQHYQTIRLVVNHLPTASLNQKKMLSEWLATAVHKNDLEFIKKLMRLEVSVHHLTSRQVLMWDRVAKLLVRCGYNLNTVVNHAGDPLLVEAAYYDRRKLVTQLLDLDVEINITCQEGHTALYWAIKRDHLDTAKVILTHPAVKTRWLFDAEAYQLAVEHGAYDLIPHFFPCSGAIDAQSPQGLTVIHDAIEANNPTLLKILLEQQPNLALTEHQHGDTPLLYAARLGRHELLPMLLVAKQNFNARDNQGKTALHLLVIKLSELCAPQVLNVARIQPLLKHGIDTYAKDAEGKTALWWALKLRQTAIANLILTHQLVKFQNVREFDAKAFALAVANGLPEMAKRIFSAVTDIDAQNSQGQPPLHQVIQENDLAAVKVILEKKPNLELKDAKYGLTPLLAAVRADNAQIVSLLLLKNVNVNAQANDGATALHLAIKAGSIECLKWLLLRSVKLELTNKAGETPLLYAARLGREQMMSILLEAGANIDATNRRGQSVMDCAFHSNSLACAMLLRHFIDKKKQQALREPAPAPVLLSKMTQMLQQLLEDNQSIKVRLDQIEQVQRKQNRAGLS